MNSTVREERLAELVYIVTLERQTIANLKDTLSMQIYDNHPRKHQALYDEYEPKIKRHAYRLADAEKELNELRPHRPPQQ